MTELKRIDNANWAYHQLLEEILAYGERQSPVRGQKYGTIELFGESSPMVFDLTKGIPVISTKKIWTKGIIEELLWFLNGDTNVRTLRSKGVHIWDDNAYEFYERNGGELSKNKFFEKVDAGSQEVFSLKNEPNLKYVLGDVGRLYGYQLRRKIITRPGGMMELFDQFNSVVEKLKNTPRSRQIALNMYDPYDIMVSALPPCHTMPLLLNVKLIPTDVRIKMAEEHVGEHIYNYNDTLLNDLNIPRYYLSGEMTQRSGDAFLGVPFNITSTALMIKVISELANMVPYRFIHKVANAHIYENHIDMVNEQLNKSIYTPSYFPVELTFINGNIVPESIDLQYSTPNPVIKAEMVV